jgi:hypothetical protein
MSTNELCIMLNSLENQVLLLDLKDILEMRKAVEVLYKYLDRYQLITLHELNTTLNYTYEDKK